MQPREPSLSLVFWGFRPMIRRRMIRIALEMSAPVLFYILMTLALAVFVSMAARDTVLVWTVFTLTTSGAMAAQILVLVRGVRRKTARRFRRTRGDLRMAGISGAEMLRIFAGPQIAGAWMTAAVFLAAAGLGCFLAAGDFYLRASIQWEGVASIVGAGLFCMVAPAYHDAALWAAYPDRGARFARVGALAAASPAFWAIVFDLHAGISLPIDVVVVAEAIGLVARGKAVRRAWIRAQSLLDHGDIEDE